MPASMGAGILIIALALLRSAAAIEVVISSPVPDSTPTDVPFSRPHPSGTPLPEVPAHE
jgi:hypothetical protein